MRRTVRCTSPRFAVAGRLLLAILLPLSACAQVEGGAEDGVAGAGGGERQGPWVEPAGPEAFFFEPPPVDDDSDDDDSSTDEPEDCPVFAEWAAVGGDGTFALPHGSIGEAIAGLPPDCLSIRLFPGTFEETVSYGSLELDIASLNGPAVTTIAAPAGGTVVTITGGQGAAASLDGVTLSGGTGTPGWGPLDSTVSFGGGLLVVDSHPTITGNVIAGNTVDGFGGGGALYGFDGLFSGNLVEGNTILLSGTGGGGGLRIMESSGAFTGNVFLENEAVGDSMDGGAIEIIGGAPKIAFNRFEENVASATGGGVRSADSAAQILANIFVGNEPDGVILTYGDQGPVVSNTFVGNTPSSITTRTCCGYTGPGPTSLVANNLVIDSGESAFAVREGVQALVLQHNDAWGAGLALYVGLADPTGADGNVSVDPLFVSSGDLRLQAGSPVVDAGQDASALGVGVDFDGVARPRGLAWDIGAYESH